MGETEKSVISGHYEAIPLSQRVESFSVSYENDGIMQECYKGTTIGYKK